MGHLSHSIHIDAPVDKIMRFTNDPHNWPAFMVGMSEPEEITGQGVGQEVKLTMLTAGIRSHETVRILEDRTEPDGSGHWHSEITGNSSGWQTWDFTPEDGGTLVAMEWDYTVPGSALGKVVDRLFLGRMMERSMLHSLDNLKLLLEESPA